MSGFMADNSVRYRPKADIDANGTLALALAEIWVLVVEVPPWCAVQAVLAILVHPIVRS